MTDSVNSDQQFISGFSIKSNIAPLHKRFFASVIDTSLVVAAFYIVFLIGALLLALISWLAVPLLSYIDASIRSAIGGAFGIILVVLVVLAALGIMHGYFIYFEYKQGQTPGKKVFGLKVVSENGARLTKKQCIIREVFRWIDNLYIPALIAMLCTDKSQRIGDIAAGTYITYSKTQEDGQEYIYMDQSDYDVFFTHLLPQRLSKTERSEFLVYSSSRFLLGNLTDKEDNEYWVSYFKTKVDYNDNVKVSDEDFLRFMAQYCCLKEREDGSSS